jgi:hypothetical protein
VGRLDRFRRLERERPDRKDAGSSAVLDRFREQPKEPDDDEGAPEGGPRSCVECGAENNAGAARCFNCDADLETPEMRAHQRRERRRAEREAEEQREREEQERRKQAEELAQREFERIRRETEARRDPMSEPIPGTANPPPFEFGRASPLVWIMRTLGSIEDPWYRFGARLAVFTAFVGLLLYSLSSPNRYPLLILALLLLGGGMAGPRRDRWRRWDRWDRWR